MGIGLLHTYNSLRDYLMTRKPVNPNNIGYMVLVTEARYIETPLAIDRGKRSDGVVMIGETVEKVLMNSPLFVNHIIDGLYRNVPVYVHPRVYNKYSYRVKNLGYVLTGCSEVNVYDLPDDKCFVMVDLPSLADSFDYWDNNSCRIGIIASDEDIGVYRNIVDKLMESDKKYYLLVGEP